MNTTHTDPDAALRDLVASADPARDTEPTDTDDLLARVLVETQPAAPPTFRQRHWQAGLLIAATVCTLALATPAVIDMTGGSGSPTATAPQSVSGNSGEMVAPDEAVEGSPGRADSDGADAGGNSGVDVSGGAVSSRDGASELDSGKAADTAGAPSARGAQTPTADEAKLVRSGNVLVGTEDQQGARDRFVATVTSLGGRITSESVITRDAAGTQPYDAVGRDIGVASPDSMGVSYPYPWYPTGPGIWISVQVPGARYDEAMAAARQAGEVVQLQQSAYDVGAQVADVNARISTLEASLERLDALMGQTENVSDVIALEKAISSRQSELDSLKAQQRYLSDQTDMAAVSLTLMSPEDATATVDPQPKTWWDSFLDGLEQFWGWLGQALLIVSPLLIAGAIILWVRRRRGGTGGPGTGTAGAGPDEGGAVPA